MRIRLLLAVALVSAAAHAQDVHVRVDPAAPHANPGNENLTVFPTIQNAMDHHPFATPNPDGKPGRVYIEIAPGTYHERVIITQNHTNITFIGKGKSPEDVVITNSLNAKQAGGTFFTETVEINGTGFEADNVTFENAAGNTGQAVAVADRADRSIFKHCRFLGHQDTLFADYGRQYYVDSYIEGGVDFIFGNAAAVFDHTELHANGPGYLTAQSRTAPRQPTGYVILNSRVTSSINGDAPFGISDLKEGMKNPDFAHGTIGLGPPVATLLPRRLHQHRAPRRPQPSRLEQLEQSRQRKDRVLRRVQQLRLRRKPRHPSLLVPSTHPSRSEAVPSRKLPPRRRQLAT
jgi:pectinesterase